MIKVDFDKPFLYLLPPHKCNILVCKGCGARYQYSTIELGWGGRGVIFDVNFETWKNFHEICNAAQQGVQLTALRRGWRARLANYLVFMGMRLAGFGGN